MCEESRTGWEMHKHRYQVRCKRVGLDRECGPTGSLVWAGGRTMHVVTSIVHGIAGSFEK